jgi:hypothetical protein
VDAVFSQKVFVDSLQWQVDPLGSVFLELPVSPVAEAIKKLGCTKPNFVVNVLS